MRKPLPHQIRVGVIDKTGELREVNIPKDSEPFARQQGWYIWNDFEQQMTDKTQQADGHVDEDEQC